MKKTTYVRHESFACKDFVIPIIKTLRDLSISSSSFVITRDQYLKHLETHYINLYGEAFTRCHKHNGDPLWHHVSDLVLSGLRRSGVFTNSYTEGVYNILSEDSKRMLNEATEEYIVNSVLNNIQLRQNVDIVKKWIEANPKKHKIVLIKKDTGKRIEREIITNSGWIRV